MYFDTTYRFRREGDTVIINDNGRELRLHISDFYDFKRKRRLRRFYKIISTHERQCEKCGKHPLILIYQKIEAEEFLTGVFCLNCHAIETHRFGQKCENCKISWRTKRVNETLDKFLGLEEQENCPNCPYLPGKHFVPGVLDKLLDTNKFSKEYWINQRGYWEK